MNTPTPAEYKPKQIVDATRNAHGYSLRLKCGHETWCAAEVRGKKYCLACMADLMERLRAREVIA